MRSQDMRSAESECGLQHLIDRWSSPQRSQKKQNHRRKIEECDVIIEHYQSIGVLENVKSDRHSFKEYYESIQSFYVGGNESI